MNIFVILETSLIVIFLTFGYIMTFGIASLMFFALFNSLRYKYRNYKFDKLYKPTFSVIVPAYNEEEVIVRTINSFLKTSYPSDKKELIIVNDASTDKTKNIVENYAYKILDALTLNCEYMEENHKNITLINRATGGKGKSFVLNEGRLYASNEILLIIDADVQLNANIFEIAAKHFSDKRVGAVGGCINISVKKGQLNSFVDFECVVAQRLLRLGFDTLGLHYIIPGGCGFFRKDVIDIAGNYDSDTLAEDTDMTWKLATIAKTKIHFDPSIQVLADEPTTLNSLWNQRIRWARGNFGVTRKHLSKIGKKEYGKLANIGYPFWLSTVLLPLTFFTTVFGLLLNNIYHIDTSFIHIFGKMMSFTFVFILIAGVTINKGKSWFAGLISPGIPILITLFANLFWTNGLTEFILSTNYSQYANIINFILVIWIISSLILVYPVMILSKTYTKTAEFIQIFILGYWTVLITSGIYGYYKEFKRDELIWIRTIR